MPGPVPGRPPDRRPASLPASHRIGHPLNGRGLEAYRAQRVMNSRWLKDLEAVNSVHRCYRPESWRDRTHFVFWFHDSTFECVARSFKVETHRTKMRALLGRMVGRLIS